MSSTRSLRWPSLVAAILLVLTAATAAGAGGSVADGSVTWPISRDLLVSEVMTGGSSASDEFIELYNAGPVARDLAGLEVVYVTASGTTITRKASWSSTTDLGPGRHLLLANSAGLYAGMADGRYSGGLAATGGVIVLRSVGGAPIDALGWGEAGNTYVEGAAAVAPSAGASVERLPGALAGNGIDSNDNLGDTFLQPAPLPQPRTADPVPTPAPSGSPLPTVSPSATPRATPSLQPTVTPTLTPILTLPRESPTATLTPTAPTPTATAAATPSVTSDPTPDPTPSPTATATATAALSPSLSNTAVAPMPIATARTLPEGTEVAVEGTLTTPLGLLEMGKGAFVQDATAGMALYLASGDWPTLGMGSAVRIQGTIDSRYGQLTLRLAAAADVEGVDDRLVIQPFGTATGTAGEMLEGSLIAVTGTITTAPEPLSDGFALTIDDGSGALRVIAVTASGIPQWDLVRGSVVSLVGALGQRDSTGTGAGGYRLYLRSPKDVTILPAPSQSPTESPPPAPSATPTSTATRTTAPTPTWSSPTSPPTAHPTPSMISTATPTPDTLWSIASARILPLGTVVTIRGVATVPPGRLIDERTFFIQEGGAGIAVRLDVSPNGRSVSTGDLLQVHGVLAQRYGTLELRVGLEDEFTKLGTGRLPAPLIVTSAELGEVTEGRLVRLEGSLVGIDRSASGSVGLTLEDATGQARVFAFPALELSPERFERGQLLAAVGIAGQRSSGRDRPDGYRVWPRDGSDLLILEEADPDPSASPPPTARPRPDPSPRPRPTPPPDPAPSPIPIARALGVTDRDVTIVGTVTTPVGLLDAEQRRVVLDDGTAAVLVRLVKKDRGPRIGDRLRVTGRVGTYYGAPQLGAEETAVQLGVGIVPQPLRMTAAPLRQVLEWRLAQVSGMITSLERHGESWRAEIALPGGGSVPVSASARSKTPATVLTEGSAATIVGIVRRPVSSARDQRFSLLPRSRADVRGAGRGSSHGGNGGPAGGSEPGTGAGDPGGGAGTSGDAATASDGAGSGGGSRSFVGATGRADTAVRDVELRDLSRHIGRRVRVGGFVARSTALRVTLEDASSTVPVLLPETARALVGMLRSREVINVTGLVRAAAKGPELVLTDPADLVRVGSLEVVSLAAVPGATPDGSSSPAPAAVTPAASVDRRSGPPLLPILLFLGASAVGFAALGWRVTSLRRSSEPSATAGRSLGLPRTGGADG